MRLALAAFGVLGAVFALAPAANAAQSGDSAHPGGMLVTPSHADAAKHRITARTPSAAARPYTALNYTQQEQSQDEWCWAADGASVEQFYGANTTQAQFCGAARGVDAGSCPNEPAYMSDVANGLHQTGYNGTAIQDVLSWQDVQRQIDGGMPVITQVDWSSGGGHARVFYGYDNGSQSINFGDPWPTYQRYQTMAYNSYLSNNSFRWTNTVYDIAPR